MIRASLLALALSASFAAPAFAGVTPLPHGAQGDAGDRHVRVTALKDGVLHIEMTDARGQWPEAASWAVLSAARAASVPVKATADGFSTDSITVSINPDTLALTVKGKDGATILDGLTGGPLASGGTGIGVSAAMPTGQHIFGMGDKTGPIDRAGKSFVDWNTDAYGFTSSTDPIYKSIPFYIAAGAGQQPYGLFLDNTFRTRFDFGARTAGRIAIDSDDGPIDLYLITGPSMGAVVQGYAWLTGPAPLPPRWAFGYQQSRWSYMSEAEVRTLVDRFAAERFPLDVVWFDIDYQDRNRPFTIDRKAFPTFEKLIADLKAKGVMSVPIVDLHVADAPDQGYAPYDSGMAGDHFLKMPDGKTYVGPVWPGPSVFPDFTRAATRIWWGKQFKMFTDMGVGGIWNDMNEPAIFLTPTKTMPLDVQHRIEGDGFKSRVASQLELHNVYGMENSRATFEGLLALKPDERPFVMTRASYAGGQRYATTWSGDNSSTWEHLKLAVQQMQSLGLSGFTFSANDAGGFTGGPSAELLTRWFQYATFMPLFRDHSQKDAPRAEPWVDGDAELAIRRHYVEERYRLLPFLYGLAERASVSGEPMMRPIAYDYPELLGSDCDTSMQFTLGGKMLIGGNPRPESPRTYPVCLPKGGWYDYWTGKPVPADAPLTITPTHDRLPVYIRAGTILPRQPLVQHTTDTPVGPIELHVYAGADCAGSLYDDDGHTRGGPSYRQALSCSVGADGSMTVQFAKAEGRYRPWWHQVTVIVHDANGERRRTIPASDRAQSVTIPPA